MTLTVLAVSLAACDANGPLEVDAIPIRTITVSLGTALRIKLQTVGPGEYASPPTLTGSTAFGALAARSRRYRHPR